MQVRYGRAPLPSDDPPATRQTSTVTGIEQKLALIRDADLLQEVEAARGGFLFAQIVEHILHRQRERDAARTVEAAREQ
ncbi:hypothetical protein ACFPYM_16195, partial [Methylobacterium hispanicum]